MFSKYVQSLIGASILSSMIGCGSGVVREPVVSLESVAVAGLGLRGGTLMVSVEIENPNRFALTANQIRYQLGIADSRSTTDTTWTDFANGVHDERISVGGGQTVEIRVPVEFSYSGLGTAATAMLRTGTFHYQASGTVDVGTPLGGREVPFRHSGMVSLLGSSGSM